MGGMEYHTGILKEEQVWTWGIVNVHIGTCYFESFLDIQVEKMCG